MKPILLYIKETSQQNTNKVVKKNSIRIQFSAHLSGTNRIQHNKTRKRRIAEHIKYNSINLINMYKKDFLYSEKFTIFGENI